MMDEIAFNLAVYAVPVIPGPDPVPFLPMCQTCGVRGCPGHRPARRRRWWHRPPREVTTMRDFEWGFSEHDWA